MKYFSESGIEVLPSVARLARHYREADSGRIPADHVLILDAIKRICAAGDRRIAEARREALSAPSQAPLTRKGTPVYDSEGRVAYFRDQRPSGSHMGSPDSSGSLARLAEPDVPLDAVRSDLERKLRLKSVMPRHEDEITRPMRAGILDELFGDDDRQCHDEDGNEVPCDDPAAVDADEAEIPAQNRFIAKIAKSPNARRESATETFTENYYGMSGDDGPPSEKPDSMQDLHGSELAAALAEEGIQLSKSDTEVNFRSAQADPPVPGASCEKCKWFDGDSGSCAVVSGLIATQTVSDLYTPKSAAEKAFTDEYETKQ